MKVRSGFVSNSSSSSFVVAFPHKPESVRDLKEMIFGKQVWHWDWISEKDVPTHIIAKKVYAKIGEQAEIEEVFESIRGGWFNSYLLPNIFPGHADCWDDPEYRAIDPGKPDSLEKQRLFWDKYANINDERAMAIAEAFCKGHEEAQVVVMGFSDNDGEGVEEHTDIFKRLRHIRTSYH